MRVIFPVVGAVLALVVVSPNAAPAGPGKAPYDPKIVPSRFSAQVTNRYFPLARGTHAVFVGTRDGGPERIEVVVQRKLRTILGVPCVVIDDVSTSNYTLLEKTKDWYSQDSAGNVWYFGEDSKEYKNGVVVSTHGSWEAGLDNAKPGIIMHTTPKPGRPYRQEYRPGVAEDMGQVVRVNMTVKVPAGRFKHVVETRDTDPLSPDKIEHKWYAPGVGLIEADRKWTGHHEHIKLVSIKRG
jgi:hypothetical protein